MPLEVVVPEPGNYFEAQEAQEKIAKFSGRGSGDAGGAVQSNVVVDKSQEMHMLVAVRMRPLWQKEDDAGDHRCVSVLQGKVVNVTDPWYDEVLNPNRQKEKRYAFDIVFDDDVGQIEVFEKTSKGLVSGVLDGYNASVFAYGATGAGKTHTMLGSLEEPGIMVNTLHEIFGAMTSDFQDSKFKVTLSYVEIYNEMVKDLLEPTSLDLKLIEDPVRGMVVQGVTEFGASTADEILELLHRGNLHRTVEPTAANQVSSRSHAVLQVTIEQSERTAHVTGNVRRLVERAVLVVPRRTTLAAWGWLSLQAPLAAPRSPGRAGEPLTQGPTGGCGVAVGPGRFRRSRGARNTQVLLRAINPQSIRPTEVEAVAFESHPLVQQVLALHSSQRLQLMYAHPEQVKRRACTWAWAWG